MNRLTQLLVIHLGCHNRYAYSRLGLGIDTLSAEMCPEYQSKCRALALNVWSGFRLY